MDDFKFGVIVVSIWALGYITNVNIEKTRDLIDNGIKLTVCHEYLSTGSRVIHCPQTESDNGK